MKIKSKIGALLLSTFMVLGIGVTLGSKDVVRGDAESKTVTYKVSSTSAVTTSGEAPDGSTATYEQTYPTTSQLTTGNNAVLTITGYDNYVVKSLTLSMKSNSKKGAGTFNFTAGSTTLASISTGTNFNKWFDNKSFGNSYRDVHVLLENDAYTIGTGETLKITIAATVSSLYIQSYTISYESESAEPSSPLASISLSDQQTEYYVGDTLSFTGTCTATYEDGTTKEVSPKISNEVDMSTAGEKTVEISYTEGEVTKTASYTINVKEDLIVDLNLSGDMTTKTYGLNSSWKNDGLVVTATYTSGKTKDITSDVNFTYNPETPNDLSLTSVIVSAKYNEFNASLTITGISVVNSVKYDLQFNNNSTTENANTSINNNELKNKYINDYSIIDVTKVSSAYGDVNNILKFGSNSSAGSITFSVIGNRTIKSVTFNLKAFGTDNTKVLISNDLKILTKNYADYSVDFSENIKEVTLKANTSSKCRFLLYSASFEVVDGEEILPTSFSITNKQSTLGLNSSIDLITTIEPTNTTLSVEWTVSIENIVTLTPSGDKNENCKVTSGETLGDVTITATIGSLSDSFTLKVEDTTIAVTKVNINKTTLEIYEQQTFQFEATVEPDNATNKEILWVSDNNNKDEFATLSDEGLFKALKATTTPIIVHAVSLDNDLIEAICEVTILKTDYYERVISDDDLKVGDEIIIGGVDSNKNIFVSSDNGNNRKQTIVSDGCVDDDGLIVYSSIMDESVAKFLVTDGTISGSLSLMEVDTNNSAFKGFLSITVSSSKNYLKTTSTKTEDNDLYISTVDNAGSITNSIKNTESEETDTRYIRYNAGSELFSSYKNKGQADIAIYRLHNDLNNPSSNIYKEADGWAMDLYEIANCDIKGSNDLDNTKWGSLKNSYNALTEPARLFIKYKLYTPVSSGEEIIHSDAIETAVEIYEYVVAKYGYEDFMSRNPVKSTNNISILNTSKTNETIALIAIISVVSLSAIGGYMFIRKRKENN